MKKIIKFIILCVIFTQFSGLKAQGPNISVESFMGFPTQAYFYDTCSFSVLLKNNDDSVDFLGYICLMFHTDTLNSIHDTIGGPFQAHIPADSFFTVTVSPFSFEPGFFKVGGNVVVVWPVSSGGTMITVTDSFFTYVDILGYSGIFDLSPGNANTFIYPVPANEEIFLQQNITENSIEHVRIIDMLGRTRILLKGHPKSIYVAELENGFYFLEIKGENNQMRIFKFIVSR
ncbi:MAG: T9SS type A sorting domain-containing protein [Bacteroidota bacterium]